jgi:2-oxoglutarate ferredoxin oxidoreductase subunit beta
MTPTSSKGYVSPSSPFGVLTEPLNPLSLALSLGCTFVARGFVGEMQQLSGLIAAGLKHRGFALIDILQPCVTFNKVQTFDYYRQKTYRLGETHDSGNWKKAMEKALETEKIPLGILFQTEQRLYEEQDPGRAKVPAVDLPLEKINLDPLMKNFY